MKKTNKKQLIVIGIITVLLIGILGFTYALFSYNKTGLNQQLVTGDIYMHYKESNTLSLNNALPSNTYDPNTYFEFTVDGKNTNTKYNIWYEIVLNYGDSPVDATRTIRIEDRFLKFRLVEVEENETTHELEENEIFTNKSYNNIQGNVIHVSTIPANTMNEIIHTYRLYMWIDNAVIIGNTNEADYTMENWNKVYGSVKVGVRGDFTEKVLETPLTSSEKVLQSIEIKETSNSCLGHIEENGITYISGGKIPEISNTSGEASGESSGEASGESSGEASGEVGNSCEIDFNYLWYSGKMWRITAIYPDGAMKLVTDNMITSISYNEESNTTFVGSYVYQWLNEDFLDTLYNAQNIIDTSKKWNVATTGDRTTIGTSEVSATVGLLNSYEYYKSYQNTSYENGYLNIGYVWWLLNPYNASYVWNVSSNGNANYDNPLGAFGVRPSVNLKSDITLEGQGTKSIPYTIVEDKSTGNVTKNINTRLSGEYVKFSVDASAPLYRIVGVENNTTKIVAVDYLRDNGNPLSKKFGLTSNDVTYGNGTTNETWDYYLNNDWYNSLVTTYGDKFTSGNYYLGTVVYGENYKAGICSSVTSATTKTCSKLTPESFNVGLLRYGEMFATCQKTGDVSLINMWLITPFSASDVWSVGSNGRASDYNPNYSDGVRPTLHLKSNIKILSGSGTENSPYIVG